MPQTIDSYLRVQGIITAFCNLVINTALALAFNRHTEFVTVAGLVVDTVITSLIMTLLITLSAAAGVQRRLQAGGLAIPEAYFQNKRLRLLARLPRRAWSLGIILGLGVTLILVPLVLGPILALGLTGLPVWGFAVLKAGYSGLAGFALVRLVVLRQILPVTARTNP